NVTWTSSNTGVATVSGGTVKAVGAGTATITASAGGKSASCTVTVTSTVTGISLNKTSMSLTSGSSETLTATITPSSASANVTWTSSNTGVATVSGGTVKAVGAGTATITASAGGKSASCTVTVSAINRGEEAFRFLVNYVKTHAYNVKGGIYYNSLYSSCFLMYDTETDTLTFAYLSEDDTVYSYIDISNSLKKPYTGYYHNTSGELLQGRANVDPTQVKQGGTLPFASWSGESWMRPHSEKLFCDIVYTILMCYELDVLSGTGYSMADLGFTGLYE
ncbi:MAG: Ig domain-containing protein, partial [Clostridia bacterium]|nr:Ig domain-containing protein [Clostridia bacterium]